tara:strand:+ start:2498 stop:2905 length:408 start_codon:yes stop_codon:yes gene_type:complete
MARIAGKSANFSFNSVAIEDELSSVEMSYEVNLPEVTSFGDAAAEFVEGLPTGAFSVSGFWDGAASQGDATIFGQVTSGEAAFIFQPTGEAADANNPNYTGNALVKSYRIRAEVGGPVAYDTEFQVNGAIARAVS